MDGYSFSDYGIFSSAVSTTNTVKTSVDNCNTALGEVKTIIGNESVFMGPIAEECVKAIDSLNTDLTGLCDNFNTISSYLIQTSSNYSNTDKNASNTIQLKLNGISTTGNGTAIASDYANPGNLSGSNLDFVNEIKDGAVDAYNKYGVLPSLTLAQAILETGWGKSRIGNNIFGIKAGSNWTGKTQNCLTGEQNADGSRYQIYADFRDYDSVSDSITDHAELLTNDRYKPVIAATNYKDACVAVRECGYATSLDYSKNLISLVEQYGLDQWDPK